MGAKLKEHVIVFLKGVAMGTADIIPGVSGGTIALITGIYQQLIKSLSAIGFTHVYALLLYAVFLGHGSQANRAKKKLTELSWGFLIALFIGIASAILMLSRLIPLLLEDYPAYTYAFFLGLVVFSIPIPWQYTQSRLPSYAIAALFTAAAFFLTGLGDVSGYTVQLSSPKKEIQLQGKSDSRGKFELAIDRKKLESSLHLEGNIYQPNKDSWISLRILLDRRKDDWHISFKHAGKFALNLKPTYNAATDDLLIKGTIAPQASSNLLVIFLAGAVAICAMVLPGISGAYILVIWGQYANILTALHNLDLLILTVFATGMLAGLFSFVRILKVLLSHYNSLTMAGLTGIMLGSLRKLWPLQYTTETAGLFYVQLAACFFVGALIVYALHRLGQNKKEHYVT